MEQSQNEALLTETLSTIWQNYLNAGEELYMKQHWLQLFLYNFQYVNDAILQQPDFKSFFNSIPEEICSFLLKRVYEIISQSEYFSPTQQGIEISLQDKDNDALNRTIDSSNIAKLLENNQNFAQLILRTPSDCNKIVALRTFLTQQLGQHLLLFLSKVEIKLIASQKSLCNLCINLFPNCRWSDNNNAIELPKPAPVFEYVVKLELYPKPQLAHSTSTSSTSHTLALDEEPTITNLHHFENETKNSDEIAYILIDLLTKCAESEYEDTLLTEQSMSTTALDFALESFLVLPSDSLTNIENAGTLKCKLLQLIVCCLNNLFTHEADINAIQLQYIIARLVAAMETIKQHATTKPGKYMSDILFGLIYIVFGMLNNIVAIYGGNATNLPCSRGQLYTLKFIDEPVLDACIQTFNELLIQNDQPDSEITKLISTIFKTLIKIIDNLCKYDRQQMHNTADVVTQQKQTRRRKCKTSQMHCRMPTLSCFFQGLLLNVLPCVTTQLQEYAAHYLMRTGTCCCHFTTVNMTTFFSMVPHIGPHAQKYVYKFIYRKLLNAVFVRGSQQKPNGKRRAITSCSKCDAKLKSLEFHADFLQLNRQLYAKLHEIQDSMAMISYLKHLKQIAHLLTNDIAAGILAEIVLPIFRYFKIKAKTPPESPARKRHWSAGDNEDNTTEIPKSNTLNSSLLKRNSNRKDNFKILLECLNTFVIYLSDLRLIKAFYNEENIKHLEDLLTQPELIRAICELIKIGIDNITFLGDHAQEQTALSRRLITLQLNSSDQAAQLFNMMLKCLDNVSKEVVPNNPFWLDEEADSFKAGSSLNPLETLHIVAFQWSLNYELLKTSQFFYNEFAKIYSIVKEDGDANIEGEIHAASDKNIRDKRKDVPKAYLRHGDKTIIDILKLNYNALSCFLLLPKKTVSEKTNETLPLNIAAATTRTYLNVLDKEADCFSSSLETLLSSNSSSFTTRTVYINFEHNKTLNFDKAIEFYTVQNTNEQTFLLQLQQRHQITEKGSFLLLFDIRQQSTVQKQQQSTNGKNPYKMTDLDIAGSSSPADASSDGGGIIAKLYGVFGTLFGGSSSNSLRYLNIGRSSEQASSAAKNIARDVLQQLCELNSDCKNLLLKLFEVTLAICIKGYQNEEVDKMQKHLRKLKALILSNASANWQLYSDEHARTQNIITQALQTLLKIAELSNTLKDPATVLSTNSIRISSYEAATMTESAITAASPHARARSITGSARTPPIVGSTGGGYNNPNTLITNSSQPPTSTAPLTSRSRPLSGESSTTEYDYFSTRASIICPDSEVEFSENEEFYMTADEGYEADGEIPEITDTEAELEAAGVDLWSSFQASSRYRSHVLHSGLCQLVVEILIELSQLCTVNPLGWCENLAQLANRLFVIRDYLGGPLFLLRGFAPILECNDVRLTELQQSLLELISDLNTPNVLSAFCSILSKNNPPVDILIKYMSYICASNTQKKTQPSIELDFPVSIDGKCVSTSIQTVTEIIDQVRNYHLHSQATTPFTRSPCIIPITHSKLWASDGFTLSLWVQVKNTAHHKNSSQLIEDDMRSSADDYLKSHIVSIGSNQAMLSIYVNNNMNLVFETCKPNAQLKLPAPQSDEAFEITNQFTTTASTLTNKTSQIPSSKAAPLSEGTQLGGNRSSNSTFHKALKPIKLLVLNSFNHMHIFNGHANETAEFEGTSLELKYFRLSKNKWTHLCFSVDTLPDCLNVTVVIDGLEQHIVSLPFRNLRSLTRSSQLYQLIALGDGFTNSNVTKSTNQATSSSTESRSTIDSFPLRFSISNLMLFNRKIILREALLHLTAMGPSFSDLTQCQVGNWKPNYGYLNMSKLYSANFGNFAESMKLLKDARILSYTAQHPDVVFGSEFHSIETVEHPTYAQQLGLILYGQLSQNHLQSFQTSTILCGGISTLLYLFARVVEVSNNSVTQSLALDILLSIALSDSALYTEFQRQDYISLIGFVIKTERCTKDVQLLKSIVNNACSQPLISKRGSEMLQVNENTTASLVYPRLFISVLHRYSDWHRCGDEHSAVLDMLFSCILALTREKHPHRDFNMGQLNKAGLLKELLNLCKVYIIESPNPVYISKNAGESFVHILSVFAGSPPSPSLMDEIMKLLLLLHKPSELYITHDRSNFYFLLKSQPPPTKDKSAASSTANFSRVAAPFRRSFGRGGERPGVVHANDTDSNLDATRLARINKLQKFHARNSPYKRALAEFEENLESVADCSRLNKQALRLVSPVEATKWRLKFKRCSNANLAAISKKLELPSKLHKSPSVSLTSAPPQKITRKRIRLHSSNSLRSLVVTDDEKRRCRRSDQDSQSSLQSLAASLAAFDYRSSDTAEFNDVFGISPPSHANTKRVTKPSKKTDFYSSLGIITLQEGLFGLLKDFLCLLPDSSVEEVLRHYVKVEFLLVLSNHSNCAVRTAILKLMAALTKRLTNSDIQILVKNLYPQHLGNQLSIYSTDVKMFEACLEWVSGLYGSLDDFQRYDCVRIQNRFGINALLAILTKTEPNQSAFTAKAFVVLRSIYLKDAEENQTLIECGLLQCCMKALHNIYIRTNVSHFKTEEAIVELLTTIGEKSFKSIGQMNIIWDILNMLSFFQERESPKVVKGFRSVQGQLQLNWIGLFFKKTNTPWNFKVTALPDTTLTIAETKTRLDLLIDRCSQFFTVFDANYTPSENEIKLFELLVSYGIATNQRCNNFIAWGLQPSRPHALRSFIINALWISCQDEFVPSIICDGKMIKSLLWLCLLEDLPHPIPHLEPLCQHLGINETDSTWNLENELGRIEVNRCNISVKQKSLLEKTVYKFEPLAVNCIESSMVLTRRLAELQNAERKLLMSHMKEYDETFIYTKWLDIISRMTHEGAPWYSKDYTENSWELDDTEGPSRVHTRLRRCHLDIDKRFIMEGYRRSNDNHCKATTSNTRPLEYLIASYDQQLNISFNSQILYNFPAKYLPVDGEIDGEIIVTDHKLYFLATHHCKYFYVCCDITNITEIWVKRYQHQEKAFEIFLDSNRSLFFSLQNQEDWKIMRDVFCDKIVTPPDQSKILLITQQWREGLLTNWEYLMTLNQISGRTYNDLMQYPVFPWILSNYNTELLDLTEKNNFRKLEKPIAVQNEENEQHYINNYSYINNTMTNMGSMILKPYHYSSHYSNSGTVLHFLVRVPPFTSYFLRYQDNNFDLPDRTFHALSTTWSLASRDSPTDVKELIPEFFCLPEMFENFERFNFGCRQSGERVEDVALPPWCATDPRLFVLVHRQALECEIVRNNLHQWIDLIFGYKQSGDNAVEAINVFHPATYSVFIESEISDPIERKAVETMVKTYGQMPRQLFKNAHPSTKILNYCLSGDKEIMMSVRGLRWGVYAGSPQLPKPNLGNIYKLPGAEYLVSFNNTNVVYGLPMRSCVMQGAEADTFNVISWGHEDRIVRIQPLSKMFAKPKNLLHNNAFDDITACGSDPNSNQLWCGHRSGRISVYQCASNDANQRSVKSRQSYARGLRLSYNSAFRKITTKSGFKLDADPDCETSSPTSQSASSISSAGAIDGVQKDSADLSWTGPIVLVRHSDEITCITLSVEFKIAVSAGRDGIAVIWDLNNWNYIRTIERPAEIHQSPITQIAVSPTLGDIVTVHTIPKHSGVSSADRHINNSNDESNAEFTVFKSFATTAISPDECFEVTEENLDDFVNVSINPNGKSILRLHSVNARYIHHIVNEERVSAVCFSFIKEGVGVNVIATALEGGLVRLWSSWNLNFVTDIVTGTSNIKSLTYSTHQHLVVLTADCKIQVWETDGLYGNSPKFPQIAYK